MYDIPIKAAVGKAKGMLNQQEVSLVFGLLPPIYAGCSLFLSRLEQVMRDWDPASTLLSPIFLESEQYFHEYSPFVNHFSEISSLIHKHMEKRGGDFRTFIMECRKHPRVNDKYLIDFLIMPVQRIPRYSLLLRELLKATSTSHPDYAGLEQALAKVDEISNFLNEQKRKAEDFSRILALQDKLTGKLSDEFKVTSGYRKIVREESVTCLSVNSEGGWKEKRATLVLLSDMVLLCNKKSVFSTEQYEVKRYWWLNEVLPIVRPFTHSTFKRSVFQLLRIAASDADRRSLHIAAESSADDANNSGGINSSNGVSLFSDSVSALQHLVLNNMAVVDLLMNTSKISEAGSLAVLHFKRGTGAALIARLARAELQVCTLESELFRVSSVRSVVVFRYLRLVASDYIQQVLSPVLESFVACPADSLQVDRPSSDLSARSTIITQVQLFLDAICNSIQLAPSELRQGLSVIADLVSAKTEGAEQNVLLYLIFDKLMLAALSQPVSYGCLTQDVPATHTGALDLIRASIAKATLRRYFDEGSNVAFLNKIIGLYHRRVPEFLAEVSRFDTFNTSYPKAPRVHPAVFQTALLDLQSCFAADLPMFAAAKEGCYDAVCEAFARDTNASYSQVESIVFFPVEMDGKDPEIVQERVNDWQRDLTTCWEASKSGAVTATPMGVMNPSTKSSLLHKKAASNPLAEAAKFAKERLSRFAPTEEEIHRNLRGKVLQSGYLWERRFFICTEHGMFVQERPSSSEMAPLEMDHATLKVDRIEGVPEWENALRVFNGEAEFSLMADTEEDMFRWKNALSALKSKEEAKVVKKAQETVQVMNKGVAASKRRTTSGPTGNRQNRQTIELAPSEKEAILMGMLAESPSGFSESPPTSSPLSGTPPSSLPPNLSASASAIDSPSTLRRDEKQQQMIRDAMAAQQKKRPSSVRVSKTDSKGKFSTLVGFVKGKKDSSGTLRSSSSPNKEEGMDSPAPLRQSMPAVDTSSPDARPSPAFLRKSEVIPRTEVQDLPEASPVLSRHSDSHVVESARLQRASMGVVVLQVKALYNGEPLEDGEMSFLAGDEIDVHLYDVEGWGTGCNVRTGEVGEFPCNRTNLQEVLKRKDEPMVAPVSPSITAVKIPPKPIQLKQGAKKIAPKRTPPPKPPGTEEVRQQPNLAFFDHLNSDLRSAGSAPLPSTTTSGGPAPPEPTVTAISEETFVRPQPSFARNSMTIKK